MTKTFGHTHQILIKYDENHVFMVAMVQVSPLGTCDFASVILLLHTYFKIGLVTITVVNRLN